MSTSVVERSEAVERASTGTSGKMVSPVTVVASCTVTPVHSRDWMETWNRLRATALRDGSCFDFHVLADDQNPTHFMIVTAWNSRAAFNAFVRQSQWLWLDRVYCPHLPTEFTTLQEI